MADVAPVFLSRLAGQLPVVLAIFVFRAVPFAAYALVTKRIGTRAKLSVVLAFGALAALCAQVPEAREQLLIRTPVILAYFLLCGLGVWRLAFVFRERRITKLGLLLTLSFALVLVPALCAGSSSVVAAIAIGWEIMLSSYSFCLDNAAARVPPSRADCLFFLLVNPTLVYNERGQRVAEPGWHPGGALRATLGIFTMLGQDAFQIGTALAPELAHSHPSSFAALSESTRSILHFSALGLGLYCAHSGLASMQIGLMQLVGYRVPERYHYPLFAVSPQEFWRRWNTWLGAWAKRYVYFPVALQIGRRFRARAQLGKLVALIVTFLIVGLLHDVVSYVSGLEREHAAFLLPSTLLFGLSALAFLGWLALEAVCNVVGLRAVFARRALRPWSALASWLVFGQFMQVVLWLAIPGTTGRALPPELAQILRRIGQLWS